MKKYRYTLDYRRGRSYIHICPHCGKREFRRYVDTETMQYVGDKVGRCNRENKCGYHYKPREYLQDNWWLKDDKKPTSYVKQSAKPKKNATHECLPIEAVYSRCQDELWINTFTIWLVRLVVPKYGEEAFVDIIRKYNIGTVKDAKDSVIFWQIDINGKVRTGKIMYYNEKTGKRIKDGSKPKVDWIHTRLEHSNKLTADFELKQCLYGEHLLPLYPAAVVFIFESEKTATVASVCFPDCVCLATGGLHGLNADKCKVLDGRTVVFFADLDATDKWRQKVEEIARMVKFAVYEVSDLLEQESTPEEREEGFDLCDYLIRELTTTTTTNT